MRRFFISLHLSIASSRRSDDNISMSRGKSKLMISLNMAGSYDFHLVLFVWKQFHLAAYYILGYSSSMYVRD